MNYDTWKLDNADDERDGPYCALNQQECPAKGENCIHYCVIERHRDFDTHGSSELDADAAKLIALGGDPGPTFLNLAAEDGQENRGGFTP